MSLSPRFVAIALALSLCGCAQILGSSDVPSPDEDASAKASPDGASLEDASGTTGGGPDATTGGTDSGLEASAPPPDGTTGSDDTGAADTGIVSDTGGDAVVSADAGCVGGAACTPANACDQGIFD
ncbi:MAG: hypothetical protein ACLQVI_01170, partial [Polyangiaceae bacterium]